VDGGLLGARAGPVDAHVLADEVALLIGPDAGVLVHQPAGTLGADLPADVLGLEGGLLVGVRLRLLLGEPLVEGLPQLLLEGRVAVTLGDRPLLGR
jgi:hypothetical protein